MDTVLWILTGLLVLFIIVSLVWRWQSEKRAIPCPSWLSWMLEPENPFSPANHARNIIAWLQLQPGMSVLDAGCGPGRLTLPVAEKVGKNGRVLALDLQEGMLQRTQSRAQAAGLNNVILMQGNLGEGNLPLQQFDRAVLVTVLGEIPDQVSALLEIYAALKPDGILSITETIFDPHFQTREKVVKLANLAGFWEVAFFGKPLAYTMQLAKPNA
ncbi:MAG: class I SAM-dependent methyltransferase [Anaerolineaceae bacterium]|nr:class I SAM-dependent methyltransferase [Anaerolineaceae bacterium]